MNAPRTQSRAKATRRAAIRAEGSAANVPQYGPTPERERKGDMRLAVLVEAGRYPNACAGCDRGQLVRVHGSAVGNPPMYPHACSNCGEQRYLPTEFWARDAAGDPKGQFPQPVVIGIARRDLNATATHRLGKFKGLTGEQIAAGGRFERDWEAARLEQRLTANMAEPCSPNGSGPAPAPDIRGTVIDARTRVHFARQALSLGGEEVVRIVEAICLFGATVESAGLERYKDRRDASIHARTNLEMGLRVLAAFYRAADQGRAA